MMFRKGALVALVALLSVVVVNKGAYADQTSDLIAQLKARGFNPNEIAVYKAQHPELFVTTSAATAGSVAFAPKQPTLTVSKNTVAVMPYSSNASVVLADLQKRGFNLKELIAYMKQHPEIFPPNVDPVTNRMVARTVAKAVQAKPVVVKPVASLTSVAPQTSDAGIISQLKARGFNPNEIAVYKAQHPEQFVNSN